MGLVRLLRSLAPLLLVAAVATACGGGSSSGGTSSDSTILGPSSGFEVRTVYARYSPGVPFGPQIPQALVHDLQSQSCPMKPRITDNLLMECDGTGSVYLLQNPIVDGKVASATPLQIGHGKIWYVLVKLDPASVQKLVADEKQMAGEQLAFSYDGTVLASAAIGSSFHAARIAITGNYDKSSATKLAQQLAG